MKERFDAKWIPEPNTGCWLWTAGMIHNGYGHFNKGPHGQSRAHRVAWILYRGPIPEGMFIDHMCRVRCCVNPDHLRVVTPAQNVLENSLAPSAVHKKKLACGVCGNAYDIRADRARRCHRCTLSAGERARRKKGILPKKIRTTCSKCGRAYHIRPSGFRVCRPCSNLANRDLKRLRRARRNLAPTTK